MTPFAALLRAYREARGISQWKLAARLPFDRSYVTRLEQGRRSPSREAVFVIAHALDLSPGELDALLVAAGYAPTALTMPPAVHAAVALLVSPVVPDAVKEAILDGVTQVVSDASRALTNGARDRVVKKS